MGTCFLYGNGGGGAKLPFRIFYGTTQPSNPKNYDIWIKTSVTVTQVDFINASWSSAAVGRTIIMGTPAGGTPSESNKLTFVVSDKSNGIPTYGKLNLTGCQQVQGSTGNWVNLYAYRYYGGTWVQFSSVIEYVIKDGVIDMTAHPYTVTENSSNETKATNSVTYNGKPALCLYGRNGAYATFSFASVTVPSWATVFYVETYRVCTVDSSTPKITIGGVSGTMSSDDNLLNNKTLSLDVSSISGKTSALTFRFMDSAHSYHWYIGNAWFK